MVLLVFLAKKALVSTFEGNLGLCDSPMSKKCGNIEPPTYKTRQESLIVEGFDWEVVVIGYACGLIIGLVIGYFATSRTNWFVRNLECTYAGDDEDK